MVSKQWHISQVFDTLTVLQVYTLGTLHGVKSKYSFISGLQFQAWIIFHQISSFAVLCCVVFIAHSQFSDMLRKLTTGITAVSLAVLSSVVSIVHSLFRKVLRKLATSITEGGTFSLGIFKTNDVTS